MGIMLQIDHVNSHLALFLAQRWYSFSSVSTSTKNTSTITTIPASTTMTTNLVAVYSWTWNYAPILSIMSFPKAKSRLF